MKCRKIGGSLPAYLAEEVAPDLRRSIKTHLRGCKKCRARLEELRAKKSTPEKKKEVASPAMERISPPKEEPPSLSLEKEGLSAGWRRPVEVSVMILLIGSALYFYQREASDLNGTPTAEPTIQPAAESSAAPPALVSSESAPSSGGSPPAPPSEGASVPPSRLPMKIHKATTQHVANEARRQAARAQTTRVKLLLISRNIKEAADTIATQAAASLGKVLSKKGDEMEAKVVLLIPAERYETFFQSLQPLGLVKDISKKQLPSEGSLKIEVMIE